jgi:hypothetical protein
MEDYADEICAWLSAGKTLREYCRQDGKPGWRLIYNWTHANDVFNARFARARDDGQDVMSEECKELADIQPSDQVEVAWRRLQIETRLKLLAKWNPKKYGDRAQVDHAGGVSINVITGVPKREQADS